MTILYRFYCIENKLSVSVLGFENLGKNILLNPFMLYEISPSDQLDQFISLLRGLGRYFSLCPPLQGRATYCFSPGVCQFVCLSVRLSVTNRVGSIT